MKKFYDGDIAKSPRIQKLYEYLNPQLKQVASGTKQEAKVVIDSETFSAWGVKTQWTGTELDKTIISINDVAKPFLDQFEISNVIYLYTYII